MCRSKNGALRTGAPYHRDFAHDNRNISCQICHSSWATTCFGCHLPMRANQRVPANKFRRPKSHANYTPYNPQVVRDDVFQLGIDSSVKNHRPRSVAFIERGHRRFAKRPGVNGFIRSNRR